MQRLLSKLCRSFGAHGIQDSANPWLTPGTTLFRPLRGLVGWRRFARTSRAMVLLAAAFVSLSGGRPTRVSLIAETHKLDAEVDSILQQAANNALAERDGSIIVIDAQTGRVRASVNPEAAYAQAMMPGSSIKPFTTLAALRAGLIDEDSRTVCPGRFTGLSFSLACVHADHLPPFTPSQAIAYSCNYYFATLGQRLGRDRLIDTARQFGLGQPTGISDQEAAGIIRPCDTGNGVRLLRGVQANHVAGQADCNAREAVGESNNLQVTPIQLLTAYTALLNGGHLYQPRIAASADFQAVERSEIPISNQHRALITQSMAGAVRYWTS